MADNTWNQASVERRPRVLLFDQDTAVRQLMASALRRVAEVFDTDGVDVALAHLGAARSAVDVVVVGCLRSWHRTQYSLAVEFVRMVFRRALPVPVVVVGDRSDAVRVRADLLLTGLREVVTTPVNPDDVVGALLRVAGAGARRRFFSTRNIAGIQRILLVLDERPDVPPLFELAQIATMSRSHLSRTFHAIVGVPLRQYGRDLRLKRAHDLLLGGRLTLTRIAAQAGFYDLPHFDKAFRRRLGISPREFRNRYEAGGLV